MREVEAGRVRAAAGELECDVAGAAGEVERSAAGLNGGQVGESPFPAAVETEGQQDRDQVVAVRDGLEQPADVARLRVRRRQRRSEFRHARIVRYPTIIPVPYITAKPDSRPSITGAEANPAAGPREICRDNWCRTCAIAPAPRARQSTAATGE